MVWEAPKTDWTAVDGVQDSDMNRIEGNISELNDLATTGKAAIAAAITAMGQAAAGSDSFATLASKISNISDDATAAAAQLLTGFSMYSGGIKVNGSMVNRSTSPTEAAAIDGTSVAGRIYACPQAGYYDASGNAWIYFNDADFIAANIPSTKNIFGLQGTLAVGKAIGSGNVTMTPNQTMSVTTGWQPGMVMVWYGMNSDPNYKVFRHYISTFTTLQSTIMMGYTNNTTKYENAGNFTITATGFSVVPFSNDSTPNQVIYWRAVQA